MPLRYETSVYMFICIYIYVQGVSGGICHISASNIKLACLMLLYILCQPLELYFIVITIYFLTAA
jgi:hypothetical protein